MFLWVEDCKRPFTTFDSQRGIIISRCSRNFTTQISNGQPNSLVRRKLAYHRTGNFGPSTTAVSDSFISSLNPPTLDYGRQKKLERHEASSRNVTYWTIRKLMAVLQT